MKKVLALLLFVCALFALTACGSSKSLAGEWTLESVTYEGEDMTEEMLAGGTMTLVLEKDGTGKWEMKAEVDGEEYSEDGEVTWEADGDNWKVVIDEEEMKGTLDGKTLTLEVDEVVYVFTK